jgi:hypothetical protein
MILSFRQPLIARLAAAYRHERKSWLSPKDPLVDGGDQHAGTRPLSAMENERERWVASKPESPEIMTKIV